MPTSQMKNEAGSAKAALERDEERVAHAITEALNRINLSLDWLQKEKDKQAANANSADRANVVGVADQLVEPGAMRVKDISYSSSLKTDLSDLAHSEKVKEIAQDWALVMRTVNHSDSHLTQADAINLSTQITDVKDRLGEVGLAQSVNQYMVENTLTKEKRSLAIEADANVALPLTPERNEVVAVSSGLTTSEAQRYPAEGKASEPSSVQQKSVDKIYNAEEFIIAKTGDTTTIQALDGKVLFEYKRDSDGNVKVSKDDITNNPNIKGDFSKAAAAMNQMPIKDILSDPTGRTQVDKLGGLAPRGSHAIAVASYVTTEQKPVVSTQDYTFRKVGAGYEVDRSKPNLSPRDKIVAIVGSDGKMAASQKRADLAYMKANYQEIKTAEMSHQKAAAAIQQARAKGKSISRRDRQAEGRGGR